MRITGKNKKPDIMEKAQINLTDEEIDRLVEPLVDEIAKAVEKRALEEVEKEMKAKKDQVYRVEVEKEGDGLW